MQPHGLQHARPPCPSPTPGVYSNSCLLSRWCHPTISSSVIPFSSHLPVFRSIRVFSNESVLHIRWPNYWSLSFNVSPSNESSGLISFRTDWFYLLAVQGRLNTGKNLWFNCFILGDNHEYLPVNCAIKTWYQKWFSYSKFCHLLCKRGNTLRISETLKKMMLRFPFVLELAYSNLCFHRNASE